MYSNSVVYKVAKYSLRHTVLSVAALESDEDSILGKGVRPHT